MRRLVALGLALALPYGIANAANRVPVWHIVEPAARGPYVALTRGPGGAMWLTSASIAGFVRVASDGTTQIYRTGNFTPAYVTLGNDGRIWATDPAQPHAVGALSAAGQLTLYVLPSGFAALPATAIVPDPDPVQTFASRSQLVVQGSRPGYRYPNAFPYPSGLVRNADVALAGVADGTVWFTECCLPAGGAAAAFPGFSGGITEYPLDVPACRHPRGIALGTDGKVYVACADRDGKAVLAIVDPTSATTTILPFPVPYRTAVNTELAARSGAIYFTPGSTPDLWSYEPEKKTFVRYPTPDGAIPTALAAGPNGAVWTIAGPRRLEIFEP